MQTGKTLFLALALAAAMLQGCGGGGSDSTQPPPAPIPPPPEPVVPPVVQAGAFELVAGTLDITTPADAPPPCNGAPALGVNLSAPPRPITCPPTGCGGVKGMAVGANGHVYLLDRVAQQGGDALYLIEIDPSTGLMQVQQIPYDPNPDFTQPAATQVNSLSSFTVTTDGSALIGETFGFFPNINPFAFPPGFGPGIWRFKDGVLSQLAGFDLPVTAPGFETPPPGQDGQGGAATFSGPDTLCAGPDGSAWVSDGGAAIRKVLPDGTVQTLNGMNANSMACATNQRAILSGADGLFHELPSGQQLGSYASIFGTPGLYETASLTYGFGDGLSLASRYQGQPAPGENSVSIANLQAGTLGAPWIRYTSVEYNEQLPAFQLDTMPYVVPWRAMAIDNNNMAYILSGNALLRYPLH